MSDNTTLMQDFEKVTEFIDTLTTSERVSLWKSVNTPEFIGLIAAELQEEVTRELDIMMEPIVNNG